MKTLKTCSGSISIAQTTTQPKNKNIKVKTVFEVSGDTKPLKEDMKALGGKWFRPKAVWSFKHDPTDGLLKVVGQSPKVAEKKVRKAIEPKKEVIENKIIEDVKKENIEALKGSESIFTLFMLFFRSFFFRSEKKESETLKEMQQEIDKLKKELSKKEKVNEAITSKNERTKVDGKEIIASKTEVKEVITSKDEVIKIEGKEAKKEEVSFSRIEKGFYSVTFKEKEVFTIKKIGGSFWHVLDQKGVYIGNGKYRKSVATNTLKEAKTEVEKILFEKKEEKETQKNLL